MASLVKIDNEKAYGTLSWTAILAILAKMKFPNTWISWIKTCLRSTSFSFLINGTPTSWISSSRGVWQGEPISSYLFILFAQNLSSIQNCGLRHDIVPGFNRNLRYNFNHLMYTNDLILITQATRRATHNIKLYLSIFW